MKKLITITTDFGDSFSAAQLRAVTASLGFDGNLIENHGVSSYSIVEGAFQILTISRFCPDGSVHVGVVDPGVGSDRAGIIIQSNNHWYVGPDNGLLYPAANRDGVVSVWKLKESGVSDYVSNTFHGRDVFIKAAVYIAQGRSPEDFQSEKVAVSDLVKNSFQNGQVLHIDHYGNLKIKWDNKLSIGKKLSLKIKTKNLDTPIVKTFSDVEPGQPLALLGSSDTLEIAINLGNAANEYSTQTGEILDIIER
jgi:S-adenosyl-L-methionine hydrolase (adenosine-forming)